MPGVAGKVRLIRFGKGRLFRILDEVPRVFDIAAVALAFLASQHHNFMMLLLALGLGDAAMRFMKVAPLV
jgi:hypothetical protein